MSFVAQLIVTQHEAVTWPENGVCAYVMVLVGLVAALGLQTMLQAEAELQRRCRQTCSWSMVQMMPSAIDLLVPLQR